MNAHTDLIDRYFDAWNETDAVRRRELIAATWSTDAAIAIRCSPARATTASTQ
ncbi:MAG: hypothetical protein CPDRYMAC_5758 [uncultured Paraburkholderia sp.]|nr:MAG: hypothetical protein CPDRYDRY_5699 [uncultured Paraburkholderia sp.]CAH2942338.1 MAG: hypothetical protein CPDRYMAC_5758 [uncultured Paraburkholderia sp.]